jgi:dihydroorotate dehydrogenase (NAD+) catalytic subunit
MAKIAERYGADGLTLINTMPRLMVSNANANYNNRTGGMSGPALRPIALRAIRQCAKAVNIPIIGCGGVSCAKDVIEMMKAGATCVQVGSQNLIDPYACKKIIEELPKLMKRLKIKNLSDIIGTSLK